MVVLADMNANAAKELRAAVKNTKPEAVLSRMRIRVDLRLRSLPEYGSFVEFYNNRSETGAKADWAILGAEEALRITWTFDGRPSGDSAHLITSEHLASLVADWKAVRNGQKDPSSATTFVDFCRRTAPVEAENPLGTDPTTVFVILGSTKTFRSRKIRGISYDDVETCLANASMLGIRLWRGVDGPVELADFLLLSSKSLSLLPQKERTKQAGFPWHADGFNGSVAVSDSGVGLKNLWVKQLAMIRGTTQEIANAVANVYPSLVQLLEAYDRCATKEEREGLLANLHFVRGPEGLSSSRRIGPAASKKIFMAFNGDGRELV